MAQWITIEWSKFSLTTVLAVYAAVLATYREVVARLEKRAKVKVFLSTSIIVAGGGRSVPHVQMRVENHGRTDINFNNPNMTIGVKGSESSLMTSSPQTSASFPLTLKPGASFWAMTELKQLFGSLREMNIGDKPTIRAMTADAINRQYCSEWQHVDLTERAK